jgi:hypothetical protein
MKIAQMAPPFESVPPGFYSRTERIVSYLTEEHLRFEIHVPVFTF